MSKYLKKGKGIKITGKWGDGEIIATYRDDGVTGLRMFRIRLGPAHFVDLPRREFELAESIIKFATIKKLLTETWV